MMRLILLTPPDLVPNEHGLVAKFFKEGLTSLHIRKPGWRPSQVEQYVAAIPRPDRSKLVLHSCHHLTSALGVGVRGF